MASRDPREGEIWTYRIADTRGQKREQPTIIVSIPALRSIPYRIAVPLVQWMKDHLEYAWMVLLKPDPENKLDIPLAADAKLCCSYPVANFVQRIGAVSHDQLQEIREAIALCIGLTR